MARALRSGRRGRRFKSCLPDFEEAVSLKIEAWRVDSRTEENKEVGRSWLVVVEALTTLRYTPQSIIRDDIFGGKLV